MFNKLKNYLIPKPPEPPPLPEPERKTYEEWFHHFGLYKLGVNHPAYKHQYASEQLLEKHHFFIILEALSKSNK